MPRLSKATPKYRKHRASGQAIVTLDGQDFYLGPHGTRTSRREYDRLVGEWQANGRRMPVEQQAITTAGLMNAYWKFAKGHYVKNGKPTNTQAGIKAALKVVRRYYGNTLAIDFGPLALKAIQNHLVEAELSRRYINDHIERIRRMFRWAASEEMIPASIVQALATVPGLRKGRTNARETGPVLPVPDVIVEETLAKLSSVVADMVRFQRLTGCRPGEACILRSSDLDTIGDVWMYRPESHKTEHYGLDRIIMIGPKAQEILLPYLLREKNAYCFSPVDSVRKRRAEQKDRRVTRSSTAIVQARIEKQSHFGLPAIAIPTTVIAVRFIVPVIGPSRPPKIWANLRRERGGRSIDGAQTSCAMPLRLKSAVNLVWRVHRSHSATAMPT